MITNVDARYPSHSGSPSAYRRPCAMIEPSSAKKMNVKLAKITLVMTEP